MSKVGIGIIGCGRMGQRYAQDIAFRIPEARLVAVCDTYIKRQLKKQPLYVELKIGTPITTISWKTIRFRQSLSLVQHIHMYK